MATIMNDAAYMGFPLSIRRGNPAPVDTTAVWYNKTELETYAATGATAYVGQILTLVADSKCEAYMISNEAGTLIKLAQTTASGDLAHDVATLQGQVADLISKVGAKAGADTEATGLYKEIADVLAVANGKVSSVEATDASVVIGGTATAPTVGVQLSKDEGNALTLEADGLKVLVPEVTHPEYSIVADSNPGVFSAVYHLTKDGANVGSAINIPKDMVVQSGIVKTFESGELPTGVNTPGTYIVLTLANATSDKLYIKVDDLIEYVTGGSGENDMVKIAVSADHKVTASITDGSITKAKLATAVQGSLDKADSAIQPAGLTSALAPYAKTADVAEGYVAKEAGKRLMTDAEDTKLEGIETGAQVNKIESVKVGGTALEITEKAVNISQISTDLLVNGNDTLILNCGNA